MLPKKPQHLAAGLLLASASPACASVLHQRQNQGRDRPWVSVDASGSHHTYVPSVTRVEGTPSQVDAPPYTLTGTVFTITQTDGAVTTSTGNPPPPRATDSDGGQGVYAVCRDNVNSNIAPFCQPRNDAEIYADEPYYITWDTHAFGSDRDTPVQIHGISSSSSSSGSSSSSDSDPFFTLGLDNHTLLGDGYHVWTPAESDLDSSSSRSLVLRLVFNLSSTGAETTRDGATITLLPARDIKPEDGGGSDHRQDEDGVVRGSDIPVAAIVVPIVVVVLLMAAVVGCLAWRRRKAKATAAGGAGAVAGVHPGGVGDAASGAIGRDRRDGHGDFPKGGTDIELTPSPTSPRTAGSNAFREEIARQERERNA